MNQTTSRRRIEITLQRYPANVTITVRGYEQDGDFNEKIAWSNTSHVGTDGYESKEQQEECVKDAIAEKVAELNEWKSEDLEYYIPSLSL